MNHSTGHTATSRPTGWALAAALALAVGMACKTEGGEASGNMPAPQKPQAAKPEAAKPTDAKKPPTSTPLPKAKGFVHSLDEDDQPDLLFIFSADPKQDSYDKASAGLGATTLGFCAPSKRGTGEARKTASLLADLTDLQPGPPPPRGVGGLGDGSGGFKVCAPPPSGCTAGKTVKLAVPHGFVYFDGSNQYILVAAGNDGGGTKFDDAQKLFEAGKAQRFKGHHTERSGALCTLTVTLE